MKPTDQKQKLLQLLKHQIEDEIGITVRAAQSAHEVATHEESVAENKYDTKGLEASYLAGAQAKRAGELRTQLEELDRLNLRSFTKDSSISISALVELEQEDGLLQNVWLLPSQGGYQIKLEDNTVSTISPGSPLGKALLGKYTEDEVQLNLGKLQKILIVKNIS